MSVYIPLHPKIEIDFVCDWQGHRNGQRRPDPYKLETGHCPNFTATEEFLEIVNKVVGWIRRIIDVKLPFTSAVLNSTTSSNTFVRS
ncbi:hypothetical protein B0T21DRAFT_366196 [Apiosordaria backusii]|uniref:Uncharacterized protein n=1 Tax=Apiosordaria backusii TaxID=314023 RepID=A0AA40BKW3_9PEZI|nr:hypothetical protein B0T21DRAFT_366196 [Apiosordaria backusii]